MAISDWPAAERPRERLLAQGPQSLSDAELLAIFLRVGLPGKSAVDLARELLNSLNGSLARLAATPPTQLSRLPGLGPAKAAQLAAVFELARRSLKEELHTSDLLNSPTAVKDWLRLKLGKLPHEIFGVLWLDSQNRLIEYDELFRGTLTQASVFPREVAKQALLRNAAAAILVHNHPSGVCESSQADELLTSSLKATLGLIDVKVVDHFIVAGNASPFSYAEKGLL